MIEFSKELVDIVSNFSTFNPGLVFRPGNVLMSKHTGANMICKAEFASVVFDQSFGIYNLKKFLAVLSMFDKPSIDLNEDNIIVSDGSKRKATIRRASENLIVHHDYKLSAPTVKADVEFDISKEDYNRLKKAISTFDAPEISIKGDSQNITISTYDVKNSRIDNMSLVVGQTDQVFNMIFNTAMIVFPDRDYHVKVGFNGLAEFKSVGETNTLTYWFTANKKSEGA